MSEHCNLLKINDLACALFLCCSLAQQNRNRDLELKRPYSSCKAFLGGTGDAFVVWLSGKDGRGIVSAFPSLALDEIKKDERGDQTSPSSLGVRSFLLSSYVTAPREPSPE